MTVASMPPMPRKGRSFAVLLGSLLLLLLALTLHDQAPDPDTWWHLSVGERILVTHAFPTSDPYSFTVQGLPWMASQWFGEILIAAAVRVGGLRALPVLLLVLGGTILLLLYYYGYLRTGSFKASAAACALLLPLAGPFLGLRPILLGCLFLLITLIILERFRRGSGKGLWLLPLLFVLWVNTHPTFVFGLLVLAAYWVGGSIALRLGGVESELWTTRQRRQLAVVFLLCLLAVNVTPYGSRLAAYPIQAAVFGPSQLLGSEPPTLPFNLWFGKYFVVLLLSFLLAQLTLRPSYRPEELALLVVSAYAACLEAQLVLPFVAIFAPLLAALLSRWISADAPAARHWALDAALIALTLACVLATVPTRAALEANIARTYPRGAAEYLRRHSGSLFHDAAWGGYLAQQGRKVFIAGPDNLYEYSGVLADYEKIVTVDRSAPFLLRKYGVEHCLVSREAGLAGFLAASPHWQKVYEDKATMVFARRHDSLAPQVSGQ